MKENKLRFFNASVFLQSQIFMLPVLLLFYQHNGLTTGDFFLFQGLFSIFCLLLEVPVGYLSDLFSKRNILVLSYSCFITRLVLWLFWAHYGYWIILIGEILYAFQKATFTGASDGYVYEYLKYRNVPQTMLKRYGKMNFFMSFGTSISSLIGAWCYHCVSQWTLLHYQKDYGFLVLILIELILNISAVSLLFSLPNIPSPKLHKKSFWLLCVRFFRIIKWTVKNSNLRYHILYAGLLSGITMVFVWSFQPMMKILAVPVSVYGLIYFMNHFCRAMSSLNLASIRKAFSLPALGMFVFCLFITAFITSFIILKLQPQSLWLNLSYFAFISIIIGFQLAFNLSNTARIHQLTTSRIRATVSSINMAVSRLYTGFFLILLKFLIDDNVTEKSLMICFFIFIMGIIPLYKVCKART